MSDRAAAVPPRRRPAFWAAVVLLALLGLAGLPRELRGAAAPGPVAAVAAAAERFAVAVARRLPAPPLAAAARPAAPRLPHRTRRRGRGGLPPPRAPCR